MGFFDKMKSMAEKARDIMSDDDDDDDDDDLDKDVEVRYVAPPTSASSRLFKMSSLNTPPAPPIPTKKESMSVRVAVNGKEYGPYEKATLIEMISNGSLTQDTLVFMDGMTQWAPANQVPKVNELFGSKTKVPPVPPVPWTSAPAAPPAPQTTPADDGLASGLSPKLKSLVISAIADGEISDLERQVLIRNAQAEGMAVDEFAVIVDAMLFNQRQALQQQKERHEQELNLAKAKAVQTAQPPVPAAAKKSDRPQVRKCPACGAIINEAAANCCPECGYEFGIREAYNPIQPLIDKLEQIESEFSSMNSFKQQFCLAQFQQRKCRAISTFQIPNSRTAIQNFLSVASSAHGSCQFGDPMKKAWKKKMEEAITTAKIKYPNDSELMATIAITAKNVGIKLR